MATAAFCNNLAGSKFIRVKFGPVCSTVVPTAFGPRSSAPRSARAAERFCWIQREPLAAACDDGYAPQCHTQIVAFE